MLRPRFNLNYNVACYGELLAWRSPSRYQQEAVDTLNGLAPAKFWLSAAHESGIYQDGKILDALREAKEFRDQVIASASEPTGATRVETASRYARRQNCRHTSVRV